MQNNQQKLCKTVFIIAVKGNTIFVQYFLKLTLPTVGPFLPFFAINRFNIVSW